LASWSWLVWLTGWLWSGWSSWQAGHGWTAKAGWLVALVGGCAGWLAGHFGKLAIEI